MRYSVHFTERSKWNANTNAIIEKQFTGTVVDIEKNREDDDMQLIIFYNITVND
jgi:hypothetical protein